MSIMSGQIKHKLQNLLQSWPAGTVATTPWLHSLGISRQLVHIYKTNGWLQSLGAGAFLKSHDSIEWMGGLYALQFQLGLNIHVGARTALALQGVAHHLPMGQSTVDLLKSPHTLLPRWFARYPWTERVRTVESNALPTQLEIEDMNVGTFNIRVASRERAALEVLALTPRLYSFEETRILMASLGTLRAEVLTKLLKSCTSEKAKRLLLYFGEHQKHAWRTHVDESVVQLGDSLLKITSQKGRYDSKYHLFLPLEYVISDEQPIKF